MGYIHSKNLHNGAVLEIIGFLDGVQIDISCYRPRLNLHWPILAIANGELSVKNVRWRQLWQFDALLPRLASRHSCRAILKLRYVHLLELAATFGATVSGLFEKFTSLDNI